MRGTNQLAVNCGRPAHRVGRGGGEGRGKGDKGPALPRRLYCSGVGCEGREHKERTPRPVAPRPATASRTLPFKEGGLPGAAERPACTLLSLRGEFRAAEAGGRAAKEGRRRGDMEVSVCRPGKREAPRAQGGARGPAHPPTLGDASHSLDLGGCIVPARKQGAGVSGWAGVGGATQSREQSCW